MRVPSGDHAGYVSPGQGRLLRAHCLEQAPVHGGVSLCSPLPSALITISMSCSASVPIFSVRENTILLLSGDHHGCASYAPAGVGVSSFMEVPSGLMV